jgi:hypothetical protein
VKSGTRAPAPPLTWLEPNTLRKSVTSTGGEVASTVPFGARTCSGPGAAVAGISSVQRSSNPLPATKVSVLSSTGQVWPRPSRNVTGHESGKRPRTRTRPVGAAITPAAPRRGLPTRPLGMAVTATSTVVKRKVSSTRVAPRGLAVTRTSFVPRELCGSTVRSKAYRPSPVTDRTLGAMLLARPPKPPVVRSTSVVSGPRTWNVWGKTWGPQPAASSTALPAGSSTAGVPVTVSTSGLLTFCPAGPPPDAVMGICR